MDPVNVDQFYIGVVSNESTLEYPGNTLSAFTNKLSRGYQIDADWVVGLTMISVPSYDKFQRMTMAEEINDTVETFDPITISEYSPPKKKKKRRPREYRKAKQTAEKKIIIKVSPTENIVLTESELKNLTYKTPHLNCGILLQTLPDKIEPKLKKSEQIEALQREILKRNIKTGLFLAMAGNSWKLNDSPVKLRRNTDEFVVHVYQHSKKSNNIILKYGVYGSLVEFIEFILDQLPVDCRTEAKLAGLLNMFHESYDLLDKKAEIVKPKNTVNLLLPFGEYSASTGLNTIEILEKTPNVLTEGISLDRVIELFRDNLTYSEDRVLSPAEKLALRTMIKDKILDTVRLETAMDTLYANQQLGKNDIILNMPIKRVNGTYDTYKTVLTAREWDNANALLNSVIAQIPVEKRDRSVFISALEESFVRAIKGAKKGNDGEASDLNAQSLQSLPYDYSDPSNPKAPAIAFPQPVNVLQRQSTPPAPAQPAAAASASASAAAATPSASGTLQPDPSVSNGYQYTIKGPLSVNFKTNTQAAAGATETTNTQAAEGTTEILESRNNPHKNRFLYVYTDIIQARSIGGQTIRCLKVIPLTDAGTRDIQFHHIEYVSVQNTYIDNISIMLCNEAGERLHIKPSTTPTFCMLHFKRR